MTVQITGYHTLGPQRPNCVDGAGRTASLDNTAVRDDPRLPHRSHQTSRRQQWNWTDATSPKGAAVRAMQATHPEAKCTK